MIYKKYIIKTILYPLLTLAFILTTLVWITQIFKLLYLIDKGIAFAEFFKLITLILPSLFFIISPLIVVLAVIYVYNKLQNERQLIILKVSGLSNFSIAKPALLVATFVTLFGYYVSLYLMPLSYNKLKIELNNFKENYVSGIIDERTFNQVSKYVTIYVDKKNDNGSLEGIILFDNKNPEQQSVLFAKIGKIIMSGDVPLLRVYDGFRQSFDANHNLTRLYFDNLTVEVKNNENLENDRNKTSLELYINEMLWPSDKISEERKIRLMIDGHQRIIWPFFNYCLVFLALSMFLSRPYNRRSYLKQMIYTFIPLVVVTYCHFTIQKIAYQEPMYIFGCYLNVFVCVIFSVWRTRRKVM